MEKAAEAVVNLGDRVVTLVVLADQLSVRGEGDLITAQIVEVKPASPLT